MARTAKQRLEQRQRDNDIREVLGTGAGRRLIWRILQRTGPYRTTYAKTDRDSARNEGERIIGLWLIQQMLTADHESYAKLLLEHQERVKEPLTDEGNVDDENGEA